MKLRQNIIKVNDFTPSEKVKDLLDKFYQATPSATTSNPVSENKRVARESALICVEEVLKVLEDTDSFCSGYTPFWENVKEILQMVMKKETL